MMTYAVLNSLFLLIIAILLALYTRKRPRAILWYTLLVVLVITAIFDSLFILFGLFEYNPSIILGIYIWKAPIEDFAYTVASVLMIGLIWEHFESKEGRET